MKNRQIKQERQIKRLLRRRKQLLPGLSTQTRLLRLMVEKAASEKIAETKAEIKAKRAKVMERAKSRNVIVHPILRGAVLDMIIPTGSSERSMPNMLLPKKLLMPCQRNFAGCTSLTRMVTGVAYTLKVNVITCTKSVPRKNLRIFAPLSGLRKR